MTLITIMIAIFNVVKAMSPVILAVISGLGMILTKAIGWGISEIFQALAVVFGGISVLGIKNALAELSASTQGAAAGTGTGQATDTSPATGIGTEQPAKTS